MNDRASSREGSGPDSRLLGPHIAYSVLDPMYKILDHLMTMRVSYRVRGATRVKEGWMTVSGNSPFFVGQF